MQFFVELSSSNQRCAIDNTSLPGRITVILSPNEYPNHANDKNPGIFCYVGKGLLPVGLSAGARKTLLGRLFYRFFHFQVSHRYRWFHRISIPPSRLSFHIPVPAIWNNKRHTPKHLLQNMTYIRFVLPIGVYLHSITLERARIRIKRSHWIKPSFSKSSVIQKFPSCLSGTIAWFCEFVYFF